MLGQPLLGTTLIPPGASEPLNDPNDILEHFDRHVQAILDAGPCPAEPTTVVDLSRGEPELVRRGRGDPALLGLE